LLDRVNTPLSFRLTPPSQHDESRSSFYRQRVPGSMISGRERPSAEYTSSVPRYTLTVVDRSQELSTL